MSKSALVLAGLLSFVSLAPAVTAPKANEFFAFCIDTHDAKKRDLQQQAQLLKELGYDGVGHLWMDNLTERLKTLDAAGLKLFQITMTVDITPGKQAYDPKFKQVMPLLKGRAVQFLLLMNGMKPSDPAGDARAVEIIREMASVAADSSAQILLYPHSYMWLERIEDANRVADKVDRPNVGVNFDPANMILYDKGDPVAALRTLGPWVKQCHMKDAVRTKTPGTWGEEVRLGTGQVDWKGFFRALDAAGFKGPLNIEREAGSQRVADIRAAREYLEKLAL